MSAATKMRFRSDALMDYFARNELIANPGYLPEGEEKQRLLALAPAQPGDTWRMTWAAAEDGTPGTLAGYAICCPRCRRIHVWTAANNCAVEVIGGACLHQRTGVGSCWQWSGEAEQNQLSAMPSLYANGPDSCGWHGWLRNGLLTEC